MRIMFRYGLFSQGNPFLIRRRVPLVVYVAAAVLIAWTLTHLVKLQKHHEPYSKKHHERTTPAQPRRYCPPPPPPLRPARLPHRFPGLECSPRYHIGFLKTHRCGSSAVQNILFRFAAHHRLVPLLPPGGSHMLGDRPFHASDRCDTYNHQLGYHIINVALRWNHPEVQRVMPNDTVYISIVREPVSQFVSMFHHLRMDLAISLEDFTAKEPIPDSRLSGLYGRNQQLFDFGLPERYLDDEAKIREKVSEIERQFHLVMITERMDESLVLLRHLLCWPTSYVVTLRLNALIHPSHLSVFSPERARLERWLRGDRLLYTHFYKLFEERVRQFGAERMRQEVAALRSETERVVAACQLVRVPPEELPERDRQTPDHLYGYSSRPENECRMFVTAEPGWLNVMRSMVEQLAVIYPA